MISRRKLVIGGVGGILFGLTAVALTRSETSIRFIGRRQTIIALLDTSTERVLIVLGEQDDELLTYVPGLKTVGNTRIDLVVASHRVLATRAAREHLHIDNITTLSVQASSSLPPIRGEVTSITGSTTLDLGGKSTMKIDVTGLQADHPDFLVTFDFQGSRLFLASSSAAMRTIDNRSPNLLAVPGPAEAIPDLQVTPHVLVCNAPDDTLKTPQIQVFPTDPTIVRIGDGSISVRDDQLSS